MAKTKPSAAAAVVDGPPPAEPRESLLERREREARELIQVADKILFRHAERSEDIPVLSPGEQAVLVQLGWDKKHFHAEWGRVHRILAARKLCPDQAELEARRQAHAAATARHAREWPALEAELNRIHETIAALDRAVKESRDTLQQGERAREIMVANCHPTTKQEVEKVVAAIQAEFRQATVLKKEIEWRRKIEDLDDDQARGHHLSARRLNGDDMLPPLKRAGVPDPGDWARYVARRQREADEMEQQHAALCAERDARIAEVRKKLEHYFV